MQKPNIVLITSDHHRADSLGCMGHPCVRTPHLDMLAQEGILFTNAHTDCPVCIPARTTLLTGIQSHVYGMPSYAQEHRIDRDRQHFLGSLMARAGYQTCLVGKRHWHTAPSFRGGFETVVPMERLGKEQRNRIGRSPNLTGGGWNEFAPDLSRLPPELYSTNWFVDRAIEFVEERDRTQPFFLWTSLLDPHPPNIIHEPYYSMYDAEDIPTPVRPQWAAEETCPYPLRIIRYGNSHSGMKPSEMRKARGVFYGKITNLDHQLGRLFGTLMAEGIWQDTLLLYTTDHGEFLGDYGTFFMGALLEGAAHIPMIVRSPKWMHPAAGTESKALVELADLLPTFCQIAGVEPPADATGTSLLGLIRGEQESVHDCLHGQIDNQHSFHDGRYKYLYFADDGSELLFDKDTDALDEHDLAADSELLDPIRRRFIEHLRDEGHAHLVDGKLLNLGRTVAPEDKVNISGWKGLQTAAKWGE